MTRNAALRAGSLFVLFAAFFGLVDLGSRIELAAALSGIAAVLCVALLLFGAALPASPEPAPLLVRASRRSRKRFH